MRKMLAFGLAVLVAGGMSVVPSRGQDKEKLKVDIEVPYVPTNEKVVAAMLKLAAVKEGETVYDLGCGDGRIVITAVKDFKAKKGLGIDFNPERLKDCEKRMDEEKLTDEQKKALTFKQGDVLKMTAEDFKDVDVVTLYLLPEVNLRLQAGPPEGPQAGRRGSSRTTSTWATGRPTRRRRSRPTRGTHTIYLWTIKAPASNRSRTIRRCPRTSVRGLFAARFLFLTVTPICAKPGGSHGRPRTTRSSSGPGTTASSPPPTSPRPGYKVLVLERRDILGGCCITEELWPGFKVSTAAYVNSLLRPEIIRDLELKKYGFEMLPRSPSSFTPFPDGRYLMMGPDKEMTHREIAKFSTKDAEAYPKYEDMLTRVADFLEPMLTQTPPDPFWRPRRPLEARPSSG